MASVTPMRRRPPIADPERFKRHAIGALTAWLEGDAASLQGHLDRALEAATQPPRSQQSMPSVLQRR